MMSIMASSSNTEIQVAVLYPDNVPDVEDVVATLILKRHDIRVQKIAFRRGDTLIVGRRALDRDDKHIRLQIDDPIVSKDQFRIYPVIYEEEKEEEGEGEEKKKILVMAYMFYCEDLETLNGTDVNGTMIGSRSTPGSPFLLTHGDKIFVQPNWNFVFKQNVGSSMVELNDIQRGDSLYFKDRYHLSNRCLGSGQFSKVLLAQDIDTKKQLACKVMDLSVATNERERQRLIHEVKILCTMNHPNIVTLQKAFQSDNSLFLFLDLAPGGDLMSFVETHGGILSDTYTMVIIRQVALAIEYLHGKGVVHRDLKPENILVMYNDIGHRVVVSDFGCASVIRSSKRMDSFVGTENYLAPEILQYNPERKGRGSDREGRGSGYTKSVDLWSLGILTFVLLTGASLLNPREENWGQEDINDRLHNPGYDAASIRRWNAVSSSAKDFMAKLIVLDPKSRMTAPDAVKHDWFTKDKKMEKELEDLYKRANNDWKPRKVEKGILEVIPGADEDSPPKAKRISKMNASPYFGLDKHLRSYGQGQREEAARTKQQLIDKLKESGETFVRTPDISTYTPQKSKPSVQFSIKSQDAEMSPHTPLDVRPRFEIPRTPTKGPKLPTIRQVDARNMFADPPEKDFSPTRKSQRESQITTQAEYETYGRITGSNTQGFMLVNHEVKESSSVDHELTVDAARPSATFSTIRSLSLRQKTPEPESAMPPLVMEFSMETADLLQQQFSSVEADASMSMTEAEPTIPARKEKRKIKVYEERDDEDELPANPAGPKKRAAPRHGTLTQEDKELNKEVLKSMPQFVTAKQYGQKVKERKQGLVTFKK